MVTDTSTNDGRMQTKPEPQTDDEAEITAGSGLFGDGTGSKNSLEPQQSHVVISQEPVKEMIYGIEDVPPIHITIISAIQQSLLALSSQLIVSLLVADVVCAANNETVKARLLSSTLLMSGITTLCMTLIGVRLPMYQGAAAIYIVPLIMLGGSENFCTGSLQFKGKYIDTFNSSINNTMELAGTDPQLEVIWGNIRSLQGSLMVAGFIHCIVGATGLVGFLTRFIGPLTIVPCLLLIFVFLVGPMLKFVAPNWYIAMSTVAIAVILSLYLRKHNAPVPIWTPSGGFRIIRYPLHQIFAILISIAINWGICAILTSAGMFTDDPNNIGYTARTDARKEILSQNPWFTFPYPGQYGSFGFSTSALIGYLVATFMSILDSVADYYACARATRVPMPPPHAVNRGILIEGICTFLSGTVGCGHATSTYGGNVGAVSVTKVASRRVFVTCGIIYILFGIFGKFSALFITIPYPVLGGAIIVNFGIFFGVVISGLQGVKLSSSRNVAVLGLSVFIGMMVPNWMRKKSNHIRTGNSELDRVLEMLMGNPNFVGTVIACFLDNTVPGTREERGIMPVHSGLEGEGPALDPNMYEAGYEVYMPLLPRRFLEWSVVKYIPFLPYRGKTARQTV